MRKNVKKKVSCRKLLIIAVIVLLSVFGVMEALGFRLFPSHVLNDNLFCLGAENYEIKKFSAGRIAFYYGKVESEDENGGMLEWVLDVLPVKRYGIFYRRVYPEDIRDGVYYLYREYDEGRIIFGQNLYHVRIDGKHYWLKEPRHSAPDYLIHVTPTVDGKPCEIIDDLYFVTDDLIHTVETDSIRMKVFNKEEYYAYWDSWMEKMIEESERASNGVTEAP